MNLIQIASDLCWTQAIPIKFDGDSGPTFKRVSIDPGSSSIGFIADLAKQRGFVLSSSPKGEMVMQKGADTGSPVMVIEKGMHPCEAVNSDIDESQYYSDVTGYVPRKSRPGYRHGEGFTVRNPYMTDVCRPFLMEMSDIEAGELEAATMALAGRMFAAVMSVSVELSTWKDSNGNTIKENTTLMLKSPGDFIYDFYEFLISDVTLVKTSDSRTASLKLVLPGVYSGKIPETMPWQR
jgi:prophage tail gpP-like protein